MTGFPGLSSMPERTALLVQEAASCRFLRVGCPRPQQAASP